MIIVSDTTPIISLLKIDQLDLLKALFGEILIPNAVFNELTSNQRFENEIDAIKSADFIKINPIKDEKTVRLIQNISGLDLGESEAIALAEELSSDFLLIDEAKGRSVAKQLGIKITGTIGILLEGFKKNILNKQQIQTCIDVLKDSKRFIDTKLFDYLMEQIG